MASIITTSLRCMARTNVTAMLRMAAQSKISKLPLAVMSSPAPIKTYATESSQEHILRDMMNPTSTDKVVMVKAKIYKSVEDVPDSVPVAQIKRARDYMRIRVSLWMAGAAAGGCFVMILWGRKLRDSGKSLQREGLQWEEEMRKKGADERAAAAASGGK